MRQMFILVMLVAYSLVAPATNPVYLFVWAGDDAKKASDFIAVIDADPSSARYSQVVASLPTGTFGTIPHHTELEMPASGTLLANGFEAGRTFVFDLRRPLHPRLLRSFGDLDGFRHPHTYLRLANARVLATFQHNISGEAGGLVEFDEHGRVYRSASAADPKAPDVFIRPYSLEILPSIDRIVSTSTAMHDSEGVGRAIQIWRLSDLKLLHTIELPPGPAGQERWPGEPRVLEDGKTVMLHTFSCGLYLVREIDTRSPTVKFVGAFKGEDCAVPIRTGRWWIQTVPDEHALVVLDITDPERPTEVSRVTFDEKQKPHWVALDPTGRRIVLNSGEYADHRLFIVDFNPQTGALKLDERFRDPGSTQPGVSMDGKSWPHGFRGNAYPHGTVFSR